MTPGTKATPQGGTTKAKRGIAPKRRASAGGKVYLLKARGYPWFKVGKSRRFTKRFRWLYTNLSFEVDLLHTIDADNIGAVEDHFKRLFQWKRVRGEWYDLTAEDVEVFKGYRCEAPRPPRPAAERMAAMKRQLQIGLQK